MEKKNQEFMNKFDINSIPNLDVAVLAALELFANTKLPELNIEYKKPLVVGSINAAATGKILFSDKDAILANESNYELKLNSIPSIDSIVLISASGGKHAVSISKYAKENNIKIKLITCNANPLAKENLSKEEILVFPKNREPYTYNTSTYMGMILGKTGENPNKIYNFIKEKVDPLIPNDLGKYKAFYVTVPARFDLIREMFTTKFVELFGRRIARDVFTDEQLKHATTVVPAKELFIDFGNLSIPSEKNALKIPLPDNADYVSMMAIGYYVIGKIQAQQKPFFKKNIAKYCKKASKLFNQEIQPIVE